MKNKEILNYSKKESIKNLMHFFDLLGINPEVFNHVYEVSISIEEFFCDDEIALFYHDSENEEDSNRIAISNKYIDRTKNKFKSNDLIIEEVSNSITHEMIHSLRMIGICNGEEYIECMPYEVCGFSKEKNALEEVIVETLTIIINICKNKKTFNINEILKELERYANSNKKPLLQIGYLLLREYGIELIYSFIFSSYNEIYIDYIVNKICSNSYLLENISRVYYDKDDKKSFHNISSSLKLKK